MFLRQCINCKSPESHCCIVATNTSYSWTTLEMEGDSFSEISVPAYQYARRRILKYLNIPCKLRNLHGTFLSFRNTRAVTRVSCSWTKLLKCFSRPLPPPSQKIIKYLHFCINFLNAYVLKCTYIKSVNR